MSEHTEIGSEKNKVLHTRNCPYCKQTYSTETGLHNWKKLFRTPTFEDWITLAMILLVLFAAWAYNQDTAICRDLVSNFDQRCLEARTVVTETHNIFNKTYDINVTNLISPRGSP